MQLIQNILSFNQILTVSLLGWLVAQVLKPSSILSCWASSSWNACGVMAVCPVPTAQRSVPWSLQPDAVWALTLPFFAVASVVAIITMHDAMGVRHETGEQAKVLNQMIDQWIEVSEKNAPFLQNMHLKEMVGHTPLQVVAGVLVGAAVGFLYPLA